MLKMENWKKILNDGNLDSWSDGNSKKKQKKLDIQSELPKFRVTEIFSGVNNDGNSKRWNFGVTEIWSGRNSE